MENNMDQVLLNKTLQRRQIWFDEFMQLRSDDSNFANQYEENEFHEWCKDYNLI